MRATKYIFKRTGTAPALPLTAVEARTHMREVLVDAVNDAYIEGLIRTAVEILEDNLGVSVVAQSWEVSLATWEGPLGLWVFPVTSITGIQYYDEANALQTLDPSAYWLDDTSRPGVLYMKEAFPKTYERAGAIKITFAAGLAADAATVPAKLKHWVGRTVADMYANRENDIIGTINSRLPWAETFIADLFHYEV